MIFLFGGYVVLKVLVETSARHIHVSEKDLNSLFGENAKLTVKKELSQPLQFAAFEKVSIVGPRGEINGVSILGPVRKNTQVEISLSDARKLGIAAEIRESGDIEGTSGCKIIGPMGEIEIPCGVIAAKRHIHLDPKTAAENNLENKETVSVKISTENRSLIFDDVVIRVSEKFSPAMHIDTDESNAAGITGKVYGEIIK